MDDCVFCKIIRGDEPSYKIWEDDECYAFLTIRPINPGHTLVIPKAHIDDIFDINDPLFTNLFRQSKELSEPIRRAFNAPRIGVAIEGFSVSHAHIHLVPVYHMAELDPNRGKPAQSDELINVQEKILKELR
jgi:histidine triad (HIT) family protein